MLSRAQQIAQPLEQIAAWVPGLQMSREENGAFGNKVSAQQEMGTQQSSGWGTKDCVKNAEPHSLESWRVHLPATCKDWTQMSVFLWDMKSSRHRSSWWNNPLCQAMLYCHSIHPPHDYVLKSVCVWGGRPHLGLNPGPHTRKEASALLFNCIHSPWVLFKFLCYRFLNIEEVKR